MTPIGVVRRQRVKVLMWHLLGQMEENKGASSPRMATGVAETCIRHSMYII